MSKKLIITLISIFTILAVVLILFWTLFALSSVVVDFQSNIQNLSITEQEIIEAGDFHYGSCVLFDGKNSSVQKIYDKAKDDKRFAYIRVVNIETIFPNKYIIHVAERERLFAIEKDGQVLICDRDLRVLDIVDDFANLSDKPILLEGLNINSTEIAVGDFLQTEQNFVYKIFSAFLQNNRTYSEVTGKFSKMMLSSYVDEISNEYSAIEMTTSTGRKFVIKNPDFAFASKVALMYSVESALLSQNVDENGNILDGNGNQIFLTQNDSGEFLPYTEEADEEKIALTYSLLEKCEIVIDNLTMTDFEALAESDIYYFLKQI